MAQHELSVAVDETRLTEAFLNWAERFSQERDTRRDRRDFVTFTAGCCCGKSRPAPHKSDSRRGEAVAPAGRNDTDWTIIRERPEGIIATHYCLCVLSAALEQKRMSLTLQDLANGLRTWWSYRENVGEDPSCAIGFMDLFYLCIDN